VPVPPHLFASDAALGVARLAAAFLCVTATTYYLSAIVCARDFFRSRRREAPDFMPPITVLKPLRGLDPEAYQNFASFFRQRYPRFQIVFGAEDPDDPALAVARRVAADHPGVDVRFVAGKAKPTANPKVGCLAGMLPEATHPFLLVSDSDIRVEPDYLRAMIAPMAEPSIGVVTCLYRSQSTGLAGRLNALGLSTDFQPSVLVARKLEGLSFGMGAGILIRRSIVSVLGGFEAIADSLADDYQLGNLPARAGHRVELADCIVDHGLGTKGWRDFLDHQLRWNRGTRAVRPGGYAGLMLLQGIPAALALLALGGRAAVAVAATTIAARVAMAWYVAVRCLEDRAAARRLWLVPLRDLFGLAMWIGGFFGSSVVWRGRRYRLDAGGRLRGRHAPLAGGEVAAVASASARVR
jgi:ceramide glucosyltransferase